MTTILIAIVVTVSIPSAVWAIRALGRGMLDAISCIVVALELRDEWRKDVYERTGVLPGREPKERKRQ